MPIVSSLNFYFVAWSVKGIIILLIQNWFDSIHFAMKSEKDTPILYQSTLQEPRLGVVTIQGQVIEPGRQQPYHLNNLRS